MRTIHLNRTRILTALMSAAMTALLASCGASGVNNPNSTGAGTSIGAPNMTLALTDPTTGATTTSTPSTLRATVLDTAGAPVPNVVVTFSTDAAFATLSPAAGTALTNASGVATISLNAASSTAGGASTVSASVSVSGTAISASIGFQVNASASAAASVTSLTFGTNPLSAYGTTSVTAQVTPANPPVTVTFSSACASNGKATLDTNITTVGGVATGSYVDNGCGATDTITASVTGTTGSTSAALVVTPPATGSLQYVSAVPTTISLQGTGGTSSSTVTFKVLDSGGKTPVSGKVVTFGLSTTQGGITFTPNVAAPIVTSNAQGLVSIIVNAGTMSTPVRVTASTCTTNDNPCSGTTLATQSNQLTITTGIPDQDSFSLAATTINTEGWSIDGLTSILTARLSDHFNNPVPDGTAVNFTTEGGSVVGSCTTTNGACTSTFTTQQPHPTNGRLTVLAFAIGEESFTDLNGNGVADLSTNEMVDANGVSTDMAEAFVDYNENVSFDSATEPYQDFNGDGTYNAGDTQYNGVLCNANSSAGTCSTATSIYVHRKLVLTMSSSTPAPLAVFDNSAPPAALGSAPLVLPACDATGGNSATMDVATFYVRVVDVNGNAMPAGTTISFATSNGALLSSASFTTMNNSGCSNAFPGCPASVGTTTFEYYPATLQSDATGSVGACTNAKTSGLLTVTVKTPGGAGFGATTTTTTFVVND